MYTISTCLDSNTGSPIEIFRVRHPGKIFLTDSVFGLYILHSEVGNPEKYRFGAGGINGGTFAGRLKTHSSAPYIKNWTTNNRRWSPIWTLELLVARERASIATSLLESALFAHFATKFVFTEGSGFEIYEQREVTIQSIREHADNAASGNIFLDIIKKQIGN